MKAQDIIRHLYKTLPKLTGHFTDDVGISSLVKSGSTVTCTTSSPHGLSTGNYIYISGAKVKTLISSIARVGTTATAVTVGEHDLTEVWHTTAEIVGADQPEYNGIKLLKNVDNRKTFKFEVTGSPTSPATGTMYLLEPYRPGFNGWKEITVINSTTFTYNSTATSLSGSADVTGAVVRKLPRISGAISVERAIDAYTKMGANKLWLFVVLGDVRAEKSIFTYGDSVASHTPTTSFRQPLMNEIKLYTIYPTSNSLSGRNERDNITDIAKYLYKCLLGIKFPTYFVDAPNSVLHFTLHRPFLYDGSYYVHEFLFQQRSEITHNDIVEPEITRAFRDLELDFENKFENKIQTTLIDLDEIKL